MLELPGRGEIEFDHVNFSYDPEDAQSSLLRDISFRVAPGEKVCVNALVLSHITITPYFSYDPEDAQSSLLRDISFRVAPVEKLCANPLVLSHITITLFFIRS